jgi:hypothetical protein
LELNPGTWLPMKVGKFFALPLSLLIDDDTSSTALFAPVASPSMLTRKPTVFATENPPYPPISIAAISASE